MPTLGAGVSEIRVHAGGEYRVLYVAKFDEAVYVLHAFRKKSRKTSKQDLDLASTRLGAVIAERRRKQQ
jgi:phage-related protein